MKNTLIVPHDSNQINLSLLTISIVTAGLIALFIFSFNLKTYINCYLLLFAQAILIFAILLFAIGLVYSYFFKHDDPAAILSIEGIWIKQYGLIPWDNVIQIRAYIIPSTSMEVIGIQVKNINSVSTTASFAGKCVLFYAKLFGYQYHITLSCLALENHEIVAFARQFLR